MVIMGFLSRSAFYFVHFYKIGTHLFWDITILKKEKKNEYHFDYIILLSLKRKNESVPLNYSGTL